MTECSGLAFAVNENRLVASMSLAEGRGAIDPAALRNLLAEAGFAGWRVSDEVLLALAERCNGAAADFEMTLAERSDASFSLEIAPDAMQVWVSVVPASGGKKIDRDEILMALGEAGVTFGIDEAAVDAACAAIVPERILIAAGKPAENGENARFELLVADVRDRAPQVSENGLIDFRELGAIPTVAAEQPLMRRHPPTAGTAGCTVRGETVAPVPGKNELFSERLVGAHVAADDANLLRATFGGQPVHCGNGVNVEQVLRVRNVNMASGNISFDGTVNIEGEVLPGMKVHATGDIVVGSVVEGAELDAGGDIRIAGGIIAKSNVRAGGSVSARFVENARVYSGTTIAIDDTALQSELQANNKIIIGAKSPRGRLAGGSVRAMMLIKTPILGSPTGGVTSILLGVNPVLEAQYQELLHTIEKQRAEEDNLEKLIKHFTKNGDKGGMLERVKASWQQALQAWAKLLPQREELERQLALIAGARIEIGDSIAGAVDITFGKKVAHLRRTYNSGSLSIENDRVVFTDASGHATPAT